MEEKYSIVEKLSIDEKQDALSEKIRKFREEQQKQQEEQQKKQKKMKNDLVKLISYKLRYLDKVEWCAGRNGYRVTIASLMERIILVMLLKKISSDDDIQRNVKYRYLMSVLLMRPDRELGKSEVDIKKYNTILKGFRQLYQNAKCEAEKSFYSDILNIVISQAASTVPGKNNASFLIKENKVLLGNLRPDNNNFDFQTFKANIFCGKKQLQDLLKALSKKEIAEGLPTKWEFFSVPQSFILYGAPPAKGFSGPSEATKTFPKFMTCLWERIRFSNCEDWKEVEAQRASGCEVKI